MKLKTDITIAGGGLAGLGLAYQLKRSSPDLDILVLEKNTFPRPKAIAKVGESTVEIGSHYLSKHLELEDHLHSEHLKKFGIRMFFGDASSDLSEQDELGASDTFGIPTYQIDRGDLENQLHAKVTDLGIRVMTDVAVKDISINAAKKTIVMQSPEREYIATSDWFFDAAGRASLLKREKGLAEKNQHRGNAIWFRIDKKIEIDDWSKDPKWHNRCQMKGKRWLSTNHLAGPGYWVWIIPLASGVTSIGIVMDDQAMAQSNIVCKETTMRWLHKYQKRCAQAIEGARFLDFVVVKDYSYGCKQTLSADGWALTGEAGVFTDPFYSPGTDFIAISNCMIVGLVKKAKDGNDLRFNAALYETYFKSIYQNTLSLYSGQYGGFGDRKMMGLKLLWDYSYYWGVLSLLFFRGALVDTNIMRELNPSLILAQSLNKDIQEKFCYRAKKRIVLPNRGTFLDQYKIPCLHHFNHTLQAGNNGTTELLVAQLRENTSMLTELSRYVTEMLCDHATKAISDTEKKLLGDYRSALLI